MVAKVSNEQKCLFVGGAVVVTGLAGAGMVTAKALKCMPTYIKWAQRGAVIGVPLTGAVLLYPESTVRGEAAWHWYAGFVLINSWIAAMPVNFVIGKAFNSYAHFLSATAGFVAISSVGPAWAAVLPLLAD